MAATANRRIRVFISSTFRDMIADRNALMSHTWPALRRLCHERHVELVEVDLRWGIAEAQSTRKETLKLCLDEIRACRPFFIGLLGERYGWTPGDEAFTPDLQEEQPWLRDLRGKSVTELEILHGALNSPDMADRAFFYLRDPAYALGRGPDFVSDTQADAERQSALKALIRTACTAKQIALRDNYPDPAHLAALVLSDLTAAIEAQFPKEDVPDTLTREAQDHEAFADVRRRTYIGRPAYFETLDGHAAGNGGPLLVTGDSGSGKSALLANWVAHWRDAHPTDVIIQHYVDGTADGADHWRLMARVMAEMKRSSGDADALPTKHDDMLRDFPLWLAKARAKAGHEGVRVILVLDALNQLEDHDHARLLGWLPAHAFTDSLRLMISTLPGAIGTDDPLAAIRTRGWQELHVEPLTESERRQMIAGYLGRFGKTLDPHRLERLAGAAPAANPLYLKILLDDLRVTGTHDRLDQRLREYLAAGDIPVLLQQVLARYRRDYELDRPGLVAEALGLIYAARRGLSENELLRLLRPADEAQLPPAFWTPLRSALEDCLVDRGGILNFAHEFLRTAVETAFAADEDRRDDLRLQIADYIEVQPLTPRTCDELPWLFHATESFVRLRACLLDINRFVLINARAVEELRGYWVDLHEQRTMGTAYLKNFERWSLEPGRLESHIGIVAGLLGWFLHGAALHAEAETLLRRALDITMRSFGNDHLRVVQGLSKLALLLADTNRLAEAEPLLRHGLAISERSLGTEHLVVAEALVNLALLLQASDRRTEAEPLLRRALEIGEHNLGIDRPFIAAVLNNLTTLLTESSRLTEAEPLVRRAIEIAEPCLGSEHPLVGASLSNLGTVLLADERPAEAEPVMRRALALAQHNFGHDHPNVAIRLNNLAQVLRDMKRFDEAEPIMRHALEIDESVFGSNHPDVARDLHNLAGLLEVSGRLAEAEPLMRRAVRILLKFVRITGHEHPQVERAVNRYGSLLQAMGHSEEEVTATLGEMTSEMFQES